MLRRLCLALPVCLAMLLAMWSAPGRAAEGAGIPAADGRRLEVLFLGSENKFNHHPIARFRVIRKALGPKGINFTYSGTTDALTPENLARFDVLLVFANHDTIAAAEQAALLDFARNGGGCVLLHCAAGCFRQADFDEYVELLGARFKSHETGVFRAEIVAPEHPVMKGWPGFECWDETYVHQRHAEDKTILQERGDEPWSWVKTYGKGRVFYTASGHDHRCWDLPEYHDLIHRAVRWTASDDKSALLDRLGLPELKYRPAAVPKDPDNPVGPLNEIQLPLEPAESLKLAQIPPGFELKVFAREPMIVNPIAIGWDHRGRLWAVEAFDYPHKAGTEDPQDRIVILEDTDRDGAADERKVFADKLNICTSVLPRHDGAIATNGPDMLYLRDTNGDDIADDRQVLFTGLGLRDTHACTSNLRHGFDGWIYATVGYSGLDVTVAGKRHQTEQAVFRFLPDGSDFEVLQNTSNNTWGLGFTEEGDLVGSTANGNPSWYLTIPNRYFEMVGRKPQQVARADQQEPLYPITTDYFQNNPKEQCSSGAGHAIYTARRFPEEWWNSRAFICEPPMHLVAAPRHENIGDRFETTHFESNLYASADAWSAPVAAEVGPDGAVWIADWYNPICNHNPFRPHHQLGPGNAHVNDDRDREHGRIYRVYPGGTEDDEFPRLEETDQCIDALSHTNLFWRLAAQRQFVESADEGAIRRLGSSEWELSRDEFHKFLVFLSLAEKVTLMSIPAIARGVFSQEAPEGGSILQFMDFPTVFLPLLWEQRVSPLIKKAAALRLVDLPPDANLGADLTRLLLTDESIQQHRHLADAIRLAVLKHPEGFVRHLIENEIDPDHPALKRTVNDLLARFRPDPSVLSDGLLALARHSEAPMAKRFAAFASAKPSPEPAEKLSESAQRGREVYFSCVACHQPDGQGLPGVFPALAKSPRVLGEPEIPVAIVLKGLQGPIESQGLPFDGLMPGHESLLDDRQIADVLNYVRSSWGNKAGEIEADTVKQVRQSVSERVEPWTAEELQ